MENKTITDTMSDEEIISILNVPGEKILIEVERDEGGRITGYAWACDKSDCNCDGRWRENFI